MIISIITDLVTLEFKRITHTSVHISGIVTTTTVLDHTQQYFITVLIRCRGNKKFCFALSEDWCINRTRIQVRI
jgi:hypothetical protein